MFGKKEKVNETLVKDLDLLRDAMERIIAGDFNFIDATEFTDKSMAEQLNDVLHSFKKNNNRIIMKINDSMMEIGDTSYVKTMIDQVNNQTSSIRNMEISSKNLEKSIDNISNSISHIKDNAYEVLKTSQQSENSMKESISVINASSEDISGINQRMQTFRSKIDKISEIIDMVKKISSQSNLLALNASIEAARAGEAGKGFAVVADQVRELASNTSASADDISRTVSELQGNINELAGAMNNTTGRLSEGNNKLEISVSDINRITSQINTIREEIDSIYKDVDIQSSVTKEFRNQTESLSVSYEELSKDCTATGNHMFKSSRHVDKVRTDMYKGNTEITLIDRLKIFELDHFLITWRVYNHIVGFEKLQLKSVENPETCKLGTWIKAQDNQQILNSPEFRNLFELHKEMHTHGTNAWNANERGEKEKALAYFNNMYQTYEKMHVAFSRLQDYLRSIGMGGETEIVQTVM